MKTDQIQKLLSQSLHLVPWYNRKAKIRKPLCKGWLDAKVCSAEYIKSVMVECPEADWAVVPSNGFMVIDLDIKNEKDGVATLREWCNNEGTTVEEFSTGCAKVKTYSGGTHLWFRYDGQLKSSDVGSGIEAKHETESVHIPPSEGYSWEKEFETIENLPQLPQWFISKWEESCARKKEKKAYLQETVDVGGRHDFLVSFGAKLRDMGMSVAEIKSSLEAVAKTRFTSEMDLHEIAAVAESFANYDATDLHALAISGDFAANVLINFEKDIAEIVEVDNIIEDYYEPIKTVPDWVLAPNDIISSWCDSVDFNCPMNQPVYCLASAIAGIATLMGRRYVFNGCFANSYVLLLGATSTGKQAPLSVTKKILRDLELGHLIGSSELASGQGISEEIAGKNELIWTIDEISFLLRGLASGSASPYILSITKMLLQLYSGASNEGTAKADGQGRVIEKPYPNILAASQPATFTECITKNLIESGFLGRFLCLTGKDDFKGKPFGEFHGSDKDPIIKDGLLDKLRGSVSDWQSNVAIACGATKNCDINEIKRDSAVNRLVQHYYDKLADKRLALVNKNLSHVSDVLSKNREKIVKLMMIHAFTSNPTDPIIVPESVKWAEQVLKIADSTIESSVNKMSENTQERDVNKIFDLIAHCKEKGVSASDITSTIRSIKKKERECIIEDLVNSGKVVCLEVKGAGKKPKHMYYLRQFMPKEKKNAG